MTKRTRIAYLCDLSPLDTNTYSGGNSRILKALQDQVGDVTLLDPGWGLAEPIRRACHRLPEALNLRLRWRLHLLLSRLIARHVARQLRKGDFDILFCAYSFQSLMNLRAPEGVKVVFTSDALPSVYKNSEVGAQFGSYLSVSRLLDPWVLRAEQCVCDTADVLLWPTEWLFDGAEDLLNMPDGKAQIVPWGANLDVAPEPAKAPAIGPAHPFHLLLIGRDFHAKGGQLVMDTLRLLRDRGIDARLDVIGGAPPDHMKDAAITHHGHLDKSVPDDLKRFNAALGAAHVLFHPSFESYGFAFCEAAAYGLPSLCLRAGGVPVRDGITGQSLPVGSTASDFADVLHRWIDAPDRYAHLRQTARHDFETRLNWASWGQKVAEITRE